MYIKIHKAGPDREVVALCDKELIGKKFSEGNIEIIASEKFYKGEELPEDKMAEILKNAKNVNIFGKKSIAFAIKLGVISSENVIMIQGVPHAYSQA